MSTNKFTPNENNKKMLPGFIAFCIAAIGAFLGFTASYFEIPVLAFIAFGVVCVGVLLGFIFVIYGIFRQIKRRR